MFLNRRGFSSSILCRECGHTLTCEKCAIALTYHKGQQLAKCHYCDHMEPVPSKCPQCGSRFIRYMGSGTELVEEEVKKRWPWISTERMDLDTTQNKGAHQQILERFAKGETQVLIGTQMVAKGLDFPDVTLVGVLSADQMLYSDDYRSFENAFSMLTQVVGRSGRGSSKGRAIIQTFTPENPIISLAASQDYDAFYNDEIVIRKAMLYPPFAQICLLGFVGDNSAKVSRCAAQFVKAFTDTLSSKFPDLPIRVLGPSPAAVPKVNNKYRYKIILKCRNDHKFRQMLSSVLTDFAKIKEYTDITVYADMHPIEL